jgi:hypothetical protein
VAGFLAILGALARSVWRDLRSFSSISGNNLMLFIVLVMYQQPQSIVFFAMVVAVLLLGPLSGDPLRKVPADRLALWPLTLRERVGLRLGSLALSPVVWVAVPFLFFAEGASFAAVLVGGALLIQLAIGLWSYWTAGRARSIGLSRTPKLPGRLGGLVQKNIRQMLSTLDVYAALLLSVSGFLYRLFGSKPDPDAFMILALVVVIALSTYAQCLFGLDLPSGIIRYRVMPLRGYQILLAKDIGFLLVAAILVAPLAPLAGFAGALVAVAVGHHGSVLRPLPQMRWRFTGGVIFPVGFLQVFPLVAVGVATARSSLWYLALALVAYVGSLWYYGREWDRGV